MELSRTDLVLWMVSLLSDWPPLFPSLRTNISMTPLQQNQERREIYCIMIGLTFSLKPSFTLEISINADLVIMMATPT